MNSSSSRGRRKFLAAAGASVGSLLAGCSGTSLSEDDESRTQTGSSDGGLSKRELSVLKHLPELNSSEYEGNTLTVRTFSPTDLTSYAHSRGYLRRLDRAIPAELDIDVGSLLNAAVGLNGTIVSLTAPSTESIDGIVSELDDSTGTVDSYTLYSRGDTTFAVDERTIVFAQPDDRLTIGPRELVERVIEAESVVTEQSNETSSEQEPATLSGQETLVRDTLSQVRTDHLLSIALPFGDDVFGADSSFTPGVRAVAWGLTVEEGPNIVTKLAAEFPEGEASTDPVVESLPNGVLAEEVDRATINKEDDPDREEWKVAVVDAVADSEYVHVNAETASVDGNTVTVQGDNETNQFDTKNPYLRERGLSNPLVIRIRGTQFEWQFDYPDFGVTGVTELRLPADRLVQFEIFGEKVLHGVYIPDFDRKDIAVPHLSRFSTLSVSETGEHELICSEYCGSGHSIMQTRMEFVEASDFENWITSQ